MIEAMTLKKTYSTVLEHMGSRLRHYRKLKKISQEELSLEIGVSNAYVGLVENGKLNPTVLRLVQLCSVLKISMKELFP